MKRKSLKSLKSLKVWVFRRALWYLSTNNRSSVQSFRRRYQTSCDSFSANKRSGALAISRNSTGEALTPGATGTTGPGTRARDQGVNKVCQQGGQQDFNEALKIQRLLINNIFETQDRRLQLYWRHH